MQPPDRDRRCHERHPVCDIRGFVAFNKPLEAKDLSLGGLTLETPCGLAVGRTYPLKLRHGQLTVSLTGTVTWCSLRRTRRTERGDIEPVFAAGIRFGSLDEPQGAALARLLDQAVMPLARVA